MALKTDSRIVLYSSDRELERGFDRLKGEALGWVFEGYPVGDYYEAALPGRDAFCMRDVSHQCMGAQALGLGRHNFNMLRKFAEGISEKRDFCSYWEIDRYDRPCPVDYTDDGDFWYNLPANFDVLDAIYRMYRWTGDRRYLEDPAFERFCALTMEEYIRRWDRDGDGIPDRIASEGRRGIASYDEGGESFEQLKAGSDLVCVMIRAYESASEMCRLTGRKEMARIYGKKGRALAERLRQSWYDPERGLSFGMDHKGNMIYPFPDPWREKDFLYRGIALPQEAGRLLDALEAGMEDAIIELFSHLPETLWKYGREAGALKALRRAMDKSLPRREYPEASYCALGATAAGLMGIDPDGEHGRVRTLSGLADVEWAALLHAQALDGRVSVEHTGHERTEFTNECAHEVIWRACFPGKGRVRADGREADTKYMMHPFSGQELSFADIPVPTGGTVSASIEV